MAFLNWIRIWLRGKKTYLLAAVILLATFALVFTGRLTPATFMVLLLVAAAGFPATLRSALMSHQAEILAVVKGVAAAGGAVAAHNLPAAERVAVQTAQAADDAVIEIRSAMALEVPSK